uniref:Uncharacterized protein n=1 Tax=Oncorhynchus kisutch TaxID=8019 RepID=A0A8C7KJX1_ONCKI
MFFFYDCQVLPLCLVQGMDEESTKAAIEDSTVGIYIIKDHATSEEPEDTGIVLEGIKVLQDLGNLAFAVAMLFGLMYAMNLTYPTELRSTLSLCEGFYGTEWGKLSNKAVATFLGYSGR